MPLFVYRGLPEDSPIRKREGKKAAEALAERREVWGVSFPTGEAVSVDDVGLVRKLRALGDFDEVAPKKKRGRPKKKQGGESQGEKKQ